MSKGLWSNGEHRKTASVFPIPNSHSHFTFYRPLCKKLQLFQTPQCFLYYWTTECIRPQAKITGMLCLNVVCLIALCRYCSFYKLKVCSNPACSKSTGTIFLTCADFCVSVSHFGNLHNLSGISIITTSFIVTWDHYSLMLLFYLFCKLTNHINIKWKMQ